MGNNIENYKDVAKKLGIKYHIGKYGLHLLPRDPSGRIYKLFSVVPLSGWVFDKHAIVQTMLDDSDFDVHIQNKSS